jgi:hypothetical protein
MVKISKKVLEQIEKENIKPIGKWSFVLKNSFLWSLFGLNILFGSVGFAISLFLLQSSDIFNLVLSVNDFVSVLLLAIPTVWVLLTLFFVFVGFLNYRYTQRGYILSFPKIFLLNLSCIFVIGLIMYSTNISDTLNRVFSENIPSYQQIVDPRYRVWNRPEDGYIAGTVVSTSKEDEREYLELLDLQQDTWEVDISDANVRRAVELKEGEKIKVVGESLQENTFQASDVLPWDGRGRNMQENHR